jgi:hypothetical protein
MSGQMRFIGTGKHLIIYTDSQQLASGGGGQDGMVLLLVVVEMPLSLVLNTKGKAVLSCVSCKYTCTGKLAVKFDCISIVIGACHLP